MLTIMVSMLVGIYTKFKAAIITTKGVIPRRTRNGPNRAMFPMLDPATGTLVIAPELDLKIRKAISREIGRIKLRLFFRKLLLQAEYLFLKARYLGLCLRYNLTGYFSNFLLRLRHFALPR